MITTAAEVRSFAQAARATGVPIIGAMIETPAAAVQAQQILALVRSSLASPACGR
jgi:phosphoenolpyruvate-protein phosphotransferase (PTS system enzyme I)